MADLTGQIIFLAELFKRSDLLPEQAMAADDITRAYNVYKFATLKPAGYASSYWVTAFGGNFNDLPDVASVQVILGQYLQRMDLMADMLATTNSFRIDTTTGEVYVNIPRKPWQYKTSETEIMTMEGFSSGPKDGKNPSDTRYGGINYPVRMITIPAVASKLSDIFSGINVSLEWSLSLANEDGHFDDRTAHNYFNTPIRLLKAAKSSPALDDFDVIRFGLGQTQDRTADTFGVKIYDVWRTLEEDVCDKFTVTDFPDAGTDVLGKNIPRIWGTHSGVPLFAIDGTSPHTHFYASPDVTAVSAVYDQDGGSLAFSFDSAIGVITEATGAAVTATLTGSTDNMIGQMIVTMMEERSGVYYNASNWDTTEADTYRISSPAVNFYADSGTVKTFITDLLKNDMAFLIQKNSGKLTLRKWGMTYDTHIIDAWRCTQKPKINHDDAEKNFLSSVQIFFGKNINSGEYAETFFDDASEETIFETYRKRKTGKYYVQLASGTDVAALGAALISRFGGYRETCVVGVGYNTAEINLLDTVNMTMTINGRTFSPVTEWIAKGVDSAQDVLTLEEKPGA